MKFRHALVLAVMFFAAVALGFIDGLPPLVDTMRFILVIAVPVVFLAGVIRPMASSIPGDGGTRATRWIRGAELFTAGTLAIALTQPLLGATSPDAIILGFGIGVGAVLASYLMILPLIVELIAGPASGPGRK